MDGFIIYRFKIFFPPELKGLTQISSFGFIPKAIFFLPELIKKYNIQLIQEIYFFQLSDRYAFSNF